MLKTNDPYGLLHHPTLGNAGKPVPLPWLSKEPEIVDFAKPVAERPQPAYKTKTKPTESTSGFDLSKVRFPTQNVAYFSKQMANDANNRAGVYQPKNQFNAYYNTTMGKTNSLLEENKQARAYVKAHEDEIKTRYGVKGLHQLYDQLYLSESYLLQTQTNLENEQKKWSSFDNEAQYRNWLRTDTDWLSSYDLQGGKAKLKQTQAELDQAQADYDNAVVNATRHTSHHHMSPNPGAGDLIRKTAERRNTLREQADTLKADVDAAQLYADNNLRKTEPGFDAFAEAGKRIATEELYQRDYASILGLGNAAERVDFLWEVKADISNWFSGKSGEPKLRGKYKFLTPEELDTYYAIAGRDGKEEALSYLSRMEETLNYRMGLSSGMKIRSIDYDPLRVKATALYGVDAGLDHFGNGLKQLTDEDRIATSPTQFGSSYIEEDLRFTGPELFGRSLGQYGYGTAVGLGNMLPAITVGALTAGAGLPASLASAAGSAMIGISAGGNAYNQALASGYSKADASNYALAVGASEGVISYLLSGISKAGGMVTGNFARNMTRSMKNATFRTVSDLGLRSTGEFVEEYLQYQTEQYFRNVLLGEDHAITPFDEDALYCGLSGALLAGLINSASVIPSKIDYKEIGTALQNTGRDDALLQTAFSLGETSKAYQLAKQIAEGKTSASPERLGTLLVACAEAKADLSFMNPKAHEINRNAEAPGLLLPLFDQNGNLMDEPTPDWLNQFRRKFGNVGKLQLENLLNHEFDASILLKFSESYTAGKKGGRFPADGDPDAFLAGATDAETEIKQEKMLREKAERARSMVQEIGDPNLQAQTGIHNGIDNAFRNSIMETKWQVGSIFENASYDPMDIRRARRQESSNFVTKNPESDEYAYGIAVENISPIDGFYDIKAHGDYDGVKIFDSAVDAQELARIILSRIDYRGQPIRLLCCNTGKVVNGTCVAQELANLLGVPVLAPNDILITDGKGLLRIGKNRFRNTGKFIRFEPK